MDYGQFQKQGEQDWEEAASGLAAFERRGPSGLSYEELETLAQNHRRVVSDFAFARTHFPGTVAERKLRSLAFRGHRLMARPEQPLFKRILAFFSSGFPELFCSLLPNILTAAGIFILAALLGAVLTILRPETAAVFMGPEGVQRVQEGEFWVEKITSTTPPALSSSTILTNNISVALMAWGGGILLGLLTIYLLLFNGLMLGSIMALTFQSGIGPKLLRFISAHGPLELTLIVIASAAGLEMARGLVFTTDQPRAAAFTEAAQRAFLLVLGTVPWFALLGLVEGYISPSEAFPAWSKVTFGVALMAAFLFWALSRKPRKTPPSPAAGATP